MEPIREAIDGNTEGSVSAVFTEEAPAGSTIIACISHVSGAGFTIAPRLIGSHEALELVATKTGNNTVTAIYRLKNAPETTGVEFSLDDSYNAVINATAWEPWVTKNDATGSSGAVATGEIDSLVVAAVGFGGPFNAGPDNGFIRLEQAAAGSFRLESAYHANGGFGGTNWSVTGTYGWTAVIAEM